MSNPIEGTLEKLSPLVEAERELHRQIAQLETQQSGLRAAIVEEMTALTRDKVEVKGYALTIVRPKPSEKLVREKLILAGVTPDQLKAGTELVTRSSYLNISAKKE